MDFRDRSASIALQWASRIRTYRIIRILGHNFVTPRRSKWEKFSPVCHPWLHGHWFSSQQVTIPIHNRELTLHQAAPETWNSRGENVTGKTLRTFQRLLRSHRRQSAGFLVCVDIRGSWERQIDSCPTNYSGSTLPVK